MTVSQNRRIGLSVFDLKCIAVVTMLIDHIGAFLYTDQLWMRYIGRLAFPIYCFLIVEGYYHTRDVRKYIGRLALFAVISEVPFDLACASQVIYMEHQNVFFTLTLGLVCVCVIDRLPDRWLAIGIVVAVWLLTGYVIRSDYGVGGLLMIIFFDQFRSRWVYRLLSVGAVNCLCYGQIQWAGTIALLPIQFYNGEKGPSAKYFFYAFYPVHLFVLYLIRRYMTNVI